MEWIKNLKISQKLLVLIAVSLFFVTIVGVVGYFYNAKSGVAIKRLYTENLKTIETLGIIRGNYEQGIADVLYLYDDISAAQKKYWRDDLKGLRAANGKLLKEYLDNPSASNYEKERIQKTMDIGKVFWADMYRSIDFAQAGNLKASSKIFNGDLHYIVEVRGLVQELVDYNIKAAENLDSQNTKDATTANIILLVTIFSSFGLLVALGLMISRMITGPITDAVEQLEEGATQVAAASSQLSAASEQLASGTSEQAAAIQETSASVEESDSMVKQNTENTQEAAILAKKTKDFASKSNQEMEKMVVSMSELKKSSDDIAKIIKVIDEIAFQTNILALNAAVEAARAGDAGKGFAVVAEEVRNLAQKSAQATKDTAVIIDKNISLSNQNSLTTQQINEDIKEMDLQSQKVSELLNEIAVASKEQAQGIEQIDKAIQQMEQVLQSNASTAEESASASHELSSQAASVKEIVNTLYAMVEGADALNAKLRR